MSHWHDDGRDDYWEQYDDREDDNKKSSGDMEAVICSDCNGSGEGMFDGSRCSTCNGTGEVWVDVDDTMDEVGQLVGQDEGELQPRGI